MSKTELLGAHFSNRYWRSRDWGLPKRDKNLTQNRKGTET